jgi:DegV family protein with EDD domain
VSYPCAMAGVAVVTDSTASLGSAAAAAGVTVVPLHVVIDGVSRAEADDAVTPAIVLGALRAGQPVTTSRPTPEAFSLVYERLAAAGYEAIVSAHLSRAMSGTYAAATLAAESAPVPVRVVDTATIAMATGFAVLAGARVARSGAKTSEVAEVVCRCAAATTTYFLVESLDYLRRGGRIGPAAALLGTALSIKPLLTVTHGVIRPHERVRTASKARARLEELGVAAATGSGSADRPASVAVHHLGNREAAGELVTRLRRRVPALGDITVTEVSAVLGAHVGPGALGIVVAPAP